jgi:hypothetical protein
VCHFCCGVVACASGVMFCAFSSSTPSCQSSFFSAAHCLVPIINAFMSIIVCFNCAMSDIICLISIVSIIVCFTCAMSDIICLISMTDTNCARSSVGRRVWSVASRFAAVRGKVCGVRGAWASGAFLVRFVGALFSWCHDLQALPLCARCFLMHSGQYTCGISCFVHACFQWQSVAALPAVFVHPTPLHMCCVGSNFCLVAALSCLHVHACLCFSVVCAFCVETWMCSSSAIS